MESVNFEFLRSEQPALADLGAFAEEYSFTDPPTALTKLRLFVETMTSEYFFQKRIPKIARATFAELLNYLETQRLLPDVVLNKMNYIRKTGNLATHGSLRSVTPRVMSDALKSAFDLGKWFCLSVHGDQSVVSLKFQPPTESSVSRLKKEKMEYLRHIAEQNARMEQVLAELNQTRELAIAEKKTNEELRELLDQANRVASQAANMLDFNEAETRALLIDQALADAGWNGKDSRVVRREVEVEEQDTPTGKGYVDYVLWDTDADRPLALIEAKKTSRWPEDGRKQAVLYADALQRKTGVRPLIFYTNGRDIWVFNDAASEIPRKIYGFYSPKTLAQRLWCNQNQDFDFRDNPSVEIVNRAYQVEAVRRVCEKFRNRRHRRALLVLATGTGKTRVAIALVEYLIRHKIIRRALFLCDRQELQKQALNAFGNFLPSENCVHITGETADDRDGSLYFSTYQTMINYFSHYDVGFFDLVIADESHRSIYNEYRDIFTYFDAYFLGLTATPRDSIAHNTYDMFDCKDEGDGYYPTAYYSFEEGVEDHYLCPFKAVQHTTRFTRDGLRYSAMSQAQREELEHQVETPEDVDFESDELDKTVFNRDTGRKILQNLMEHGIREATGQHIGKTILFARSHRHALWLQKLFEEMYPQYMQTGHAFCEVIDSHIERREVLLDEFKDPESNLYLAISVDMLDTGVDVPEVVNLVFAKPVKSLVKFWQMIGRGTRLCKNLFGPGRDKKEFLIFDHWENFEYFGQNPTQVDPKPAKSLFQRLFELRIELAEEALQSQNREMFDAAVALIHESVMQLPSDSLPVRDAWRDVNAARQKPLLEKFEPATVAALRNAVAPLMQWCSISGNEEAYRCDVLLSLIELARAQGSGHFQNLRGNLQNDVAALAINLPQVRAKLPWIEKVKNTAFWAEAAFADMEDIRLNLRSIMKYRQSAQLPSFDPLEVDVKDEGEERVEVTDRLTAMGIPAYKNHVESLLRQLLDEDPVLAKIQKNEPVSDDEIRILCQKVILRDPDLDLNNLLEVFPQARSLVDAIRLLIGVNTEVANEKINQFLQENPGLTSNQLRFLDILKKRFAQQGGMELGELYDAPFTSINTSGVSGIFPENQVKSIERLVEELNKSLK